MCIEVLGRYTCKHTEKSDQDIEPCEEAQARGQQCDKPETDFLDFNHPCTACGGPPKESPQAQQQPEWVDDEEGIREALQESLQQTTENEEDEIQMLLEASRKEAEEAEMRELETILEASRLDADRAAEAAEDDELEQALQASRQCHFDHMRQLQAATNDDEEEAAIRQAIEASQGEAAWPGDFDDDQLRAATAASREQYLASQLGNMDIRDFVPEQNLGGWNKRPGIGGGFAPQEPVPVEYIKRTLVYKACGHRIYGGDSSIPRGPGDPERQDIPATGLCNRCHAKQRAAANAGEGQAGPSGTQHERRPPARMSGSTAIAAQSRVSTAHPSHTPISNKPPASAGASGSAVQRQQRTTPATAQRAQPAPEPDFRPHSPPRYKPASATEQRAAPARPRPAIAAPRPTKSTFVPHDPPRYIPPPEPQQQPTAPRPRWSVRPDTMPAPAAPPQSLGRRLGNAPTAAPAEPKPESRAAAHNEAANGNGDDADELRLSPAEQRRRAMSRRMAFLERLEKVAPTEREAEVAREEQGKGADKGKGKEKAWWEAKD